jgi:hypothetical protein
MVTLVEPVDPKFHESDTRIVGLEYEKLFVSDPSQTLEQNPADTAIFSVPVIPLADKDLICEVETQLVASAAVLLSREAELSASEPKLDPNTVTEHEPVAAMFAAVAKVTCTVSTERTLASVMLPSKRPLVS